MKLNKNSNLKILGLTATPFKTSESEKGLLKKIFTHDIVFKVDLKDLIKILCTKRMFTCFYLMI